MKDKASQKTEDEVLDQTFGGDQTFDGFDEDMTAQTQDQTKESNAKPEKKKSSGSSNTLLFVAGGVAAVGILGYMFVLKPMMNGGQQVAQQAPSASVVPPAAAPQPPVAATPSAPSASPERQVAQDFLTGNAPVVTNPAVVPSVVEVAPVVVNAQTMPNLNNAPAVAMPAQAPVVVPPVVVTSNATSSAVVDELSRRFDNQNQQFKISLDEVGNRVSNLEKFKDEQLNVNKNVDERLTKLEGGKVVKAPVVSQEKSVAVVRKPVVVAKAPKVREVKEVRETSYGSNVLIDKTEVKVVKKEAASAAEYNIHSVYGGRVWLKNSDGSLSTFTSGDKLPSGEVIKNINDEKFSIVTDKRTIQKR